MGADSKYVHIFIAEIEVSGLYIHVYYISIYNEFENRNSLIASGMSMSYYIISQIHNILCLTTTLICNCWKACWKL